MSHLQALSTIPDPGETDAVQSVGNGFGGTDLAVMTLNIGLHLPQSGEGLVLQEV